ncbi:MAG: protein jag [Oscillospiraceae bacterium]|jgi:spoIIIJ-associated protein|nr:protein jag [Oscillospiraceae bacterium]
MTTTFIDVTGKTEDEAVSAALAQLGMDRDQVSVEVLERAKKGFLGIGASPAKVRVTYAVETPAPDRKPEPPAPRPAAPRPAPAAAAAPASAPPREEHPRRERPERRRSDRPRPEPAPRAAAQEEEALPALQPVDLGELCTDERAQKITAFLTGLLQHMGSSAQVKVYQPEEGRYKVILEGEKLGQLIGRRGETLDAIQQLTNYSINRGGEKRVRVHVDAENYRLKREQSLQHLARKVAAKVVKYRRNVTLEPMNAYERHVIHTALQDVPGVTTYSMGTDPNRRVIVAYDRSAAR